MSPPSVELEHNTSESEAESVSDLCGKLNNGLIASFEVCSCLVAQEARQEPDPEGTDDPDLLEKPYRTSRPSPPNP